MSLRVKLFAAFIALILVPLFLLGMAAYFFISDMLEEKYSQQAELTLHALSQSVAAVFQETNKLTDSTIANTALQEVFNKPGNGEQHFTAIDYLELNEIQRNFRELLVNHPSVSYALMYTLQDQRINEIYSKENFKPIPFEDFRGLDIFSKVMERQGLPVWVGPNEYPQLTGNDDVFTQIRVVKDIATLRDQGILFVQIKNSSLDNLFRYFRYKEEEYETRFFILNDSGLILYDSSGLAEGRSFEQYMGSELVLGEGYQSMRGAFEQEDSLISHLAVDIGSSSPWHLMSVTSWDSLSGEMTLYAKWVAIITAMCLLSAFIFIWFFVQRTARSIVHTVRFMRRVERGDLEARMAVQGTDETAYLSRGVNSLVERVSELLRDVKLEQERKTKAELMLMQAQIHPHFLFNVLESINMLATQNEGPKVSAMVRRLANILRISIHQNDEIRICEELGHVKSYLEIQKFRFEDLFDFEIDVPDGLMHCQILKLSLQPLVENSIQHGFEGISYMGRIRIAAREWNDSIVFMVEDNGRGIPSEVLAAMQGQERRAATVSDADQRDRRGAEHQLLQERLSQQRLRQEAAIAREADRESIEETMETMQASQELRESMGGIGVAADAGRGGSAEEREGLGLRNVADRIRVRYGERGGLMICSMPGGGTVIRIRIPKQLPVASEHLAAEVAGTEHMRVVD